ncbi:MAG: flagellar hook-associated protein FlgL [Candidatus Auribacterota bacterium]|nr:flagellar hook-associated protein FlgL [Candidatus Auribacterota bacterium]
MLDRITNSMKVNRTLQYLSNNMNSIQKTQEQISSGKMIRVASDDPIGAIQSMTINNSLKKVAQYGKNIDNGISFLEHTSSVLTQIEDILMEIKTIAENGASDVTTSAERSAFAFQVDQMLQELIQAANSKYEGKFIFGGTETLSGTAVNSAPFNIRMSGSSIAGVIQNPKGISGEIKRLVNDGKYVTINIAGDAVFQPNGEGGEDDIFQTIIKLRENLLANDGNEIQKRIRELDNEFDLLVGQNTLAGSKVVRMQLISDQLEDLKVIHKEHLSNIEDTDVAEAIMRLQIQEVTLQATLNASSRILQKSLLDYI